MPLEAKSLSKASIPPELLGDPSPGSIQSTRLALNVSESDSSCSVYIASGCQVYKIVVSLEDSIITEGKEGLLIPVSSQVISSSSVDRCPHRAEIQSIVLAEGDGSDCLILGTVDCYGHLIVSRLNAIDADIDGLSYSVLPGDCGVGEGSWAGICFSPDHWSTIAVARSFCKTIDIYDQDIHLRSLHTLWYPGSLAFFQRPEIGEGTTSVLAVAEGSQLSIWDLRTTHNGGCVQRVCDSVGDVIYSVCTSPSGAVAVGGSNRTVTIYDPRRWSAMSRWVGCSKYEITGLAFSSLDSSYVYVQGVDYELMSHLDIVLDVSANSYLRCPKMYHRIVCSFVPFLAPKSSKLPRFQLPMCCLIQVADCLLSVLHLVICGNWKESKKTFSFRGDSNWLGFSKCVDADVLAGWCDSGSLFVADVVDKK